MTRKRFTDFGSRVLAAVCRIPPGRLATYGDVARIAGRPRAARAVGNIMRACNQPGVPCHRVVAAGGRLGGYGGNIGLKRSLLRAEGVRVVGSRIRDAAERRWPGPPARGGHGRPGPSSSQRRPRSAPTAVCGNPGPSGVVSFNGLRR
jgi:O-6-methylguanine DNA methyltransferase